MAYKTRFCPTIEIEKTGIPSRDSETELRLTLIPSINELGDKVKPTIVESDIIGITSQENERIVCNKVVGNIGDLLIIHHDSAGDNVAKINNKGELIISTYDDENRLYSRSSETELGKNLMYNDPFADISYFNIVDENNNPISDVFIQIKSGFNQNYVTKTEDGKAFARGRDGQRYQLVLAKSGYNQLVIDNWMFNSDQQIQIIYPLIEKTIWDGMYSDTAIEMYVDTHDGGHA